MEAFCIVGLVTYFIALGALTVYSYVACKRDPGRRKEKRH